MFQNVTKVSDSPYKPHYITNNPRVRPFHLFIMQDLREFHTWHVPAVTRCQNVGRRREGNEDREKRDKELGRSEGKKEKELMQDKFKTSEKKNDILTTR